MKLITWNVQWCRGVDGKVDPARIVRHAKAIADFDVLCLQEIANNYSAPRLAGSRGENQFAELARLLPGYTPVPGVAVDVPADDGARRHFGNMMLSPQDPARKCSTPIPCCTRPASTTACAATCPTSAP